MDRVPKCSSGVHYKAIVRLGGSSRDKLGPGVLKYTQIHTQIHTNIHTNTHTRAPVPRRTPPASLRIDSACRGRSKSVYQAQTLLSIPGGRRKNQKIRNRLVFHQTVNVSDSEVCPWRLSCQAPAVPTNGIFRNAQFLTCLIFAKALLPTDCFLVTDSVYWVLHCVTRRTSNKSHMAMKATPKNISLHFSSHFKKCDVTHDTTGRSKHWK